MDYQDDTLTNASKNRAASRKLFQQWGNNANPSTRTAETEGTTVIQQQQQKQYDHFQAMSLNSLDHHHQQQQLQHCPSSSSPSAHQQVFLHRSPSGAQRKIRQKVQQQQQNQQQFPLANGFSMPSPQQQQFPSTSGRSVIHENGYKSILDRDEMTNGSPSLGQLIDRMNRLDLSSSIGGAMSNSVEDHLRHSSPSPIYHHRPVPVDPPPSPWATASGGGGGSIDKVPMPSSPLSLIGPLFGDHQHHQTSSSSQQQQQHQQFAYPSPVNTPFAKPTVQVHPLPVPPRHRSLSAIAPPLTAQLATKPTPPPLPPKKHSLATSFLLTKRGSALDQIGNESGADEQKSYGNGVDIPRKSLRWAPSVPSAAEETNSPPLPVEKRTDAEGIAKSIDQNNSKENEEVEENEKQRKSGGADEGAEKERHGGESARHRTEDGAVGTTPSVRPKTAAQCAQSPPLSLSSSPSLTSLQNCLQFAADNPEKHSGEQLEELEKRRLYSIESLARKIADREQDRELLCRDLTEIDNIRASLFARVGHNGALVGRLNNLLIQTEKLADLETKIHFQMERMMLSHGTEEMVRCLREQLLDLRFLRSALDEREGAIDAEMAEELGEAEGLQEWLFCREQLAKLSAERCHLNMRLCDVRTLLESLQGICLMPTAKRGGENAPALTMR